MTRGCKGGGVLLELAFGCGDFEDAEFGEGEEEFVGGERTAAILETAPLR